MPYELKGCNGESIISKCLIMNLLMTQLYMWMVKNRLRNVQYVVHEFCELSGAIINWNKSMGIRMKNEE